MVILCVCCTCASLLSVFEALVCTFVKENLFGFYPLWITYSFKIGLLFALSLILVVFIWLREWVLFVIVLYSMSYFIASGFSVSFLLEKMSVFFVNYLVKHLLAE